VLKNGDSMQAAVTAEVTDGQYHFTDFHDPAGTSVQFKPSVWEIRLGVKYTF